MEEAHRKLRKTVADDLLDRIKAASPAFFEKLVIKLLLKMGCGGSLKDAGKAIGKSGDGGVDGIIKEDRLGLDVIYVQAKRWDGNPVGRPAVQEFAGALQGHHAAKGILITTSRFTPEARDFVRGIGSKIVLIDGEELANYLLDFNVGVYVAESYELKRIDSDFFEDED
jgi:restriction system protein